MYCQLYNVIRLMCHYSVFLVCFVFFFKQKTAYEMRISDWSSDVCSSDLVISRSPTDVQPVFDAIAESSVRLCSADYGSANRLEGGMVHLEIGRASCRERVCQYV